jgi:hypothetical protein
VTTTEYEGHAVATWLQLELIVVVQRSKERGGGGGQEGGNWREKGNGSEGGRRRICSSCVAHVVDGRRWALRRFVPHLSKHNLVTVAGRPSSQILPYTTNTSVITSRRASLLKLSLVECIETLLMNRRRAVRRARCDSDHTTFPLLFHQRILMRRLRA